MTKTRRIEITIETHEITRTHHRGNPGNGRPEAADQTEAVNEIVGAEQIRGIPALDFTDVLDICAEK